MQPTVFFQGLSSHYTKSSQWTQVVRRAQQQYVWLNLTLSDQGDSNELRISLASLSSESHWSEVRLLPRVHPRPPGPKPHDLTESWGWGLDALDAQLEVLMLEMDDCRVLSRGVYFKQSTVQPPGDKARMWQEAMDVMGAAVAESGWDEGNVPRAS